MSKFVFKVSRFLPETQQLRLAEYYQRRDDSVRALATLHFNHLFLSGIPLAYVYPNGQKSFSFHRKDIFAEHRLNFVINFPGCMLEGLEEQLDADVFINPTSDDAAVSLLRKWQLHVQLEELVVADLHQREANGFLSIYIPEDTVKEVYLVNTKDKEFVHTPGEARVKLELLMETMFNKVDDKALEIPQTLEETGKVVEEVIGRAKKRGQSRRAKKLAQQQTVKNTLVITESDDDSNVDDME